MNHRIRRFWGISLGLILLFAVIALVWGNAWRTATANRYYNKADFERARERYEDLLVDMPKSPYLLHNLGLSLLRKDRNDKAITNLREATAGLEELKTGKSRKKKLKNEFYYNLGNALYVSAEKSQDQQSQANYQEALESFKQAIEADPRDLNAKYNYELTLLRLKQPPPSQQPEQQQNEAQNIVDMNDSQYFVPQIGEEEPVDKDW